MQKWNDLNYLGKILQWKLSLLQYFVDRGSTKLNPISKGMIHLRQILAKEPKGLLTDNNSIIFIVDSGNTGATTTHNKNDSIFNTHHK